MKKTMKRLIAALIAVFTLTAVLSMSSFAATRTQCKKYSVYTCLGDSVAAGYSHPGYNTDPDYNQAEWAVVPNTYPDILQKATKAKIHQLAHSGYRTTDLRALLYNDYNGDGMSPLRLPSTNNDCRHMNYDKLNELRAAFQNDIAESDLITLNIGINDSTQPLMITMETLAADYGLLGSQLMALLDPYNYVKNTLLNLQTLMTDAQFYVSLAQAELDSFRMFSQNFDAIIYRIHELNPNAKVVVIGLYNASENDTIPSGGIGIPIGDVFGSLYSSMNQYMESGSQYASYGWYTYVDTWGISSHMNDPSSPMYRGDNHPTLTGHGQIADKVLAVLPKK
ncbi:MAG: hypothetical protein IKX83_05410 [Clostridia bacterium]|nr:hypothetical protein [Clostridia bacterium]